MVGVLTGKDLSPCLLINEGAAFGVSHPISGLLSPVSLALGHVVPTEVQFPVEATPGEVRGRDVLERVVRDHVDDGADDRSPVPGHLSHQGLQPACSALDMGVKEC